MNFLELAKRTRQELGVSGDGPPAVTGQIGHYAKIVGWVRDAFVELQESPALQAGAMALTQVPLLAGKSAYDGAQDWGLDIKTVPAEGQFIDGAELCHVDWLTFRRLGQASGLPTRFSVAPGGELHFWPEPDRPLTLDLEYERDPQVLMENLDVPRIPARYHMAIVWRAVMFGCAHDENPALFQSANLNYRAIMNRVNRRELPELIVGTML